MTVMKQHSIKNIAWRFVGWILLLQMINISIDPPSLKFQQAVGSANSKAASIDEIESIYEMVAEGVFDKDVPDDNQDKDEDEIHTSSPSMDLYFSAHAGHQLPQLSFPSEYFPHYHNINLLIYTEPNSPPPKYA
ncbi:MAG TPA: hypothetical protein VMR70_01315 [Flavisolibacter sp.]|nr:hypothetical protein [Flavisolibacter sp.]